MAKLTKKRKEILRKVDLNKLYPLEEAAKLAKETNTANFDATIDIAIRLGIDPKKIQPNSKRYCYATSRHR